MTTLRTTPLVNSSVRPPGVGAAARGATRQRLAVHQVGAHQQRLDQALAGPRGGDPLVRLRDHLRQRERGGVEQPRELVDFQHVVQGVAADALRIALEGGPDLGAGHVLAVLLGDPEVARGLLEPLVAHVADDRAVAADGVERVHDLAAGDDPAGEAVGLLADLDDVLVAARGAAVAPERQVDAERAGPAGQELQVEPEDVVVLQDVRVALAGSISTSCSIRPRSS